jgi:hypothetical protein
VKNLNVININRKIDLQKFQENIYFTEYSNKKILNIKRYIYDRHFCIKEKKNRIKRIINHNDILMLNHLTSFFSSKCNVVNKKDINDPIDKDVIIAPHYAFMTIEHKWQTYNKLITSQLSEYLHPEILIRTMSTEMQDITIIDFFRRGLHLIAFKSCCLHEAVKNHYQKNIKNILYHLWAKEFDFFIKKEFYILYNQFNFIYNEKSSFLKKMTSLTSTMKNLHLASKIPKKCLQQSSYILEVKKERLQSSNYLRYGNQWITSFETNIGLIPIFIYRCIHFWKYRMGLLLKKSEFSCIKLNQSNCYFLGSILRKTQQKKTLSISLFNRSLMPKTWIEQKFMCIKLPLVNIICILSKYGLCDRIGYPISKSSWSTWPDSKIIERFTYILVSISIYYSGCINKKKLSHIQYILSYSCAKTLACKHKTNLRSIWYQYNKEFHQNSLLFKEKILMTKNLNHINQQLYTHRTKTWNLNYTECDPIISLIVE